jgi:predicted phosphodiesterase
LENRWDPSAWSPTQAAIPFAEYWRKQTLEHADDSGALNLLVHFDEKLPPGKKVRPVFLYGNHDNYLGVAGVKHTLKAQFNEDPGLVAQHGHQVDGFNSDENARLGYIITQACFVTHEARGLENPMSALIAEKSSKNGPRLDATQMALEECIFRPLLKKDTSPAMTFVMGHTHEPLLQEIVVLQRPEKNPAKSEPPEYSPLPLNRLLQKVKVTARFIQVDFVDDSYSDIPGFCMNWHLSEVRTIPLVEPLIPKKAGILIYDQKARAGQTVPAQAGAGGTLTINACEELEVRVETSNGHVVSQRVAVKGWEGIHTIEYAQPSGKGRYTVTFELVWGEFVD